ncbi:Peroxisome biogenesis factor 2 [Nymphon striatum]|nr:Peroxisome biogenesis factor 2 [Nymphon striatum]
MEGLFLNAVPAQLSELVTKDKFPVRLNYEIPEIVLLDSIELQKQLYHILKSELRHCFKIFFPFFLTKYEPELEAVLKYIILKETIFSKHASVGQQILNLKYDGILLRSRYFQIIYSIVMVLIPWMKDRSHDYVNDKKSKDLFKAVKSVADIVSILNSVIFLMQGKHATLVERFLGLVMVPATGQNKIRMVSYEYMNRELLWHGLMDCMKVVLQIINLKKLKLFLGWKLEEKHEVASGRCNICERPYVMPHHIGCNHAFCYYCIMNEFTTGDKVNCIVCGKLCNNVSCIQLLRQG